MDKPIDAQALPEIHQKTLAILRAIKDWQVEKKGVYVATIPRTDVLQNLGTDIGSLLKYLLMPPSHRYPPSNESNNSLPVWTQDELIDKSFLATDLSPFIHRRVQGGKIRFTEKEMRSLGIDVAAFKQAHPVLSR